MWMDKMKNAKLWLWGLMLFLLAAPTALAVQLPTYCWHFDDTKDDSCSALTTSTLTGTARYITGMQGKAINLTDSDYLTVTGMTLALTNGANSVGCWIKPYNTPDSAIILGYGTDGAGETRNMFYANGPKWGFWGWGQDVTTAVVPVVDRWYHYVWTFDGTNLIIYINGTQVKNGTPTLNTGNSSFVINRAVAGPGMVRSYFAADECFYYNSAINASEILAIYQNGFNYTEPADVTTVTLNAPTTNSMTNNFTRQTVFSYTPVTNDGAYKNCTLYTNETGAWLPRANMTPVNNTVNSISPTYNYADAGGSFIWNVKCFTNTLTAWGSSNWTLIVDVTLPEIITNFNGTMHDGDAKYLNSTINFSDTYLHSFNIWDDQNNLIGNHSNITGTYYQYNLSLNVENYTVGKHFLYVNVSDGHTANRISNYDTAIAFDTILYRWGKDWISITPDTKKLKEAKTEKKIDRYTFEYKTKKAFTNTSFIVRSSLPIMQVYHDNMDFGGWLISGNHWIDFETEDVTAKKYIIERITDYEYKITVKGSFGGALRFSSIGDLNTVSKTFEWYKYEDSTPSFDSQIMGGESNVFSFNLSFGNSTISSIGANLIYNNTVFNVNSYNYSSYYLFNYTMIAPGSNRNINYSFYWNYTLNGIEYNSSSGTQEVGFLKMDNCTAYGNVWVNFTVYDETNNSKIGDDINFNIYVMWNYTNITGSFSINDPSYDYLGLCIDPSWALADADIDVQYSLSGYDTRDYLRNNFQINNSNSLIKLYMLGSGTSTPITIHVIDDADNDLKNVLVQAYRWDVATNTELLVETENTDDGGQALLDLEQGTAYYSFKLFKEGILVYSTNRFKLFSSSYTFIVTEKQINKFSEWIAAQKGTTSLSYDNATNKVTFSWAYSDTLFNNFCLNITDFNSTRYSICNDSLSGSLEYTITPNNLSYTISGIVLTTTGNSYVIESESVDTNWQLWRRIGSDNSIILVIIIILVSSLLAMIDVSIAIITPIFALIILNFFGIMPLGNMWVTGLCFLALVILIIINRREVY